MVEEQKQPEELGRIEEQLVEEPEELELVVEVEVEVELQLGQQRGCSQIEFGFGCCTC